MTIRGLRTGPCAEHLAAAGVLHPAALTDDQAVKLGADAVGSIPTEPTEIACGFEKTWRRLRGESDKSASTLAGQCFGLWWVGR
jgi:hypothetical protein